MEFSGDTDAKSDTKDTKSDTKDTKSDRKYTKSDTKDTKGLLSLGNSVVIFLYYLLLQIVCSAGIAFYNETNSSCNAKHFVGISQIS